MTDFLQLAVYFIAAVNPAAAAAAPKPDGRQFEAVTLLAGGAVALGLAGLCALMAGPILDSLGIEPETFRVGAGTILLLTGGLALWNGGAPHAGPWDGMRTALFPLAIPVLGTPAVFAGAVSYGADDGAGPTIGALALAIALTVVLLMTRAGRAGAAMDGLARVTGGLLMVVAAGLIVDGVRAI